MNILQHTRVMNLIGFILALGLVVVAMFLQIVKHLDPCPLCIFQRLAFLMIAGWFFFFMLLPQNRFFFSLHGVLQILTAGAGCAIALRQTYLQYTPGHEAVSCGPGFQAILANTNLPEAITLILKGTGDCNLIDWRLFGLSMAIWSAVGFLFFLAWGVWWLIKR